MYLHHTLYSDPVVIGFTCKSLRSMSELYVMFSIVAIAMELQDMWFGLYEVFLVCDWQVFHWITWNFL